MNQFRKQVQLRSNLYTEYVKLINGILGLTNKQVLVLSKIMELTESTPMKRKLLDRENRKEILETCQIDECNLSTYLTLFKSKEILVKSGDQWVVNINLFPTITKQDGIKVIFDITYNE